MAILTPCKKQQKSLKNWVFDDIFGWFRVVFDFKLFPIFTINSQTQKFEFCVFSDFFEIHSHLWELTTNEVG